MPIYRLPEHHSFPNPAEAEDGGLLAVGGDLDPARVLLAYYMGIFPWYSEDQPILWWSPDPRTVLYTDQLKVGRSLRKRVRNNHFRVTLDEAFDEVIRRCRTTQRPGQAGTWITEEMEECYSTLHNMGFAHSCETWDGDQLVGGLYGISIGKFFAGESMFFHKPDASKVAFVHLVAQLREWGFPFIDCQMPTEHLQRFGAQNISRSAFLSSLQDVVVQDGPPTKWSFSETLQLLP